MTYTTNCIQDFNLVLASNSPRRSDLLTQAGYNFSIIPAEIDEAAVVSSLSEEAIKLPENVVKELAFAKASAVTKTLINNISAGHNISEYLNNKYKITKILAADTIVAFDSHILGKPKDKEDAVKMLKYLSGNTHQVFTGFSISTLLQSDLENNSKNLVVTSLLSSVSKTEVEFYTLSDEDINWYVNTKEPLDKAGSYGIQGLGARFVKRISGDYNNVVGLPLAEVCKSFL